MTASKLRLVAALCVMLVDGLSCAFALDPILPEAVAHPTKLIGTWSAQAGNIRHEVTFKADLTFSGKCIIDGKVTDEYSGRWYLDYRDILSWTYLQSKTMDKNTTDSDRIMSIDTNSMSLLTSGRKVRNYTKVPNPKK